jgi:futalosine hydrolase
LDCREGKMLVVAAVAEELGDLHGDVLGVGPVRAAASTARRLSGHRPSAVVLLGTAGRYPGGPPVGTVVCAVRIGWSEGVAVLGLGYVPKPPVPLMTHIDVRDPLGLPGVNVLTTGAVTTDPELAAKLGRDWDVENLEAYSVAYACAEAGVPFAAVLGITNDAGPDAHVQWSTHRRALQDSAREAVRALRTHLDRGAR